jgi:hypothetical protein
LYAFSFRRQAAAVMTFIPSMRRHSQVKTPWRLFLVFCTKRGVRVFCVNDSPVKRAVVRTAPSSAPPRSQGIHKGAAAPLVGGAGSIDACQALFLGAQRAPGVGGTYPAPACPWGKQGKGDQIPRCRRLFLPFRSAPFQGPLCSQFNNSLLCRSTAATRLASIRTRK